MQSNSITNFALAALFLIPSMVNGHMIMKSPKPFATPDNGPLTGNEASQFPCKKNLGFQRTADNLNTLVIGEANTLSFTGSAVHGGGSCQVALTTDLEPTASTKWMVIKSIEGGCPASVSGNLPADPNGSGASTFQYTVPDGIAPGDYTIAWTWLNKIGNREFYMNCGAATVVPAKKKRYVPEGVSIVRRQESFPDLYLANLAGVSTCTTTEGSDYIYPDPGADVEKDGSGPFETLSCGATGGGAAQSPASNSGGSSGNGTSGTDSSSGAGAGAGQGQGSGSAGSGASSSGSPTAASPPSAVSPGNFASGAASGVASSSGSDSSGSSSGSSGSSTGSSAGSAGASTAGSASSGSSSGAGTTAVSGSQQAGAPCTSEGAWSCSSDGSSYQRCASGVWSQAMAMPAGVVADCSGSGFSMKPASS